MADSELIDQTYVPLGDVLSREVWPADYFGSADFGFLNAVAYVGGDIYDLDDYTWATVDLQVVAGVEFELPFGFAAYVGEGQVTAEVYGDETGFDAKVLAQVLGLRLPRKLFVPVVLKDGRLVADPNPDSVVDIEVPFGIRYTNLGDENGCTLSLPAEDDTALRLPQCMVGDTGVIISAEKIIIRLSDSQSLPDSAAAAGIGDGWRGVYIGEASVTLPKAIADATTVAAVVCRDCYIGSGGFTGQLAESASSTTTAGTLLGMDFTYKSLTVDIVQNSLTKFELAGDLKIPFFDDTLAVTVSIDTSGKISVTAAAAIFTLTKAGIFEMKVDSVGVDADAVKGECLVRLSGDITPLAFGSTIHWPSFRVEQLGIDSKGNVLLDGGWVDLRNQAVVDLYGFHAELTRIGFGRMERNGDSWQWLGFSASVTLVDGFKAGASVDGLRILWNDSAGPELVLEGIGVDLEIPNAIAIVGKVSLAGEQFTGAVAVRLPSINFAIDGQFVTGSKDGVKYFAVYLHGELPAGIPLAQTGLAFYGMSGLFAKNMRPDRQLLPGTQDQERWYQNEDLSDGWYLRSTGSPVTGAADLAKWGFNNNSYGFGAGITLGTYPDNGYMVNGRLLLVLVFPGPIIMIEGKANLFKQRASLEGGDPMFRALAVIDPSSSFVLDLDARYQYKSDGELIDLHAGAEAYFDFNDASGWHLWMGVKGDRKRMVGARLFRLFDVGSYFMLDSKKLDVGAGWWLDKKWGFKHVYARVKASLEEEAIVSWHPSHFTGSMALQGSAELRAYGIGFGVGAGAEISGDVFDPFKLHAELHFSLNLPWPLPDVGVSLGLDWAEPMSGAQPALPVPLQDVSVEFPARELRWPLQRGGTSPDWVPNYDQGQQENRDGNHDGASYDFNRIIEVPADSVVTFTFSRPIDDPDFIGANAIGKLGVPPDRVGDKSVKGRTSFTVEYELESLTLEKLAPLAAGADPGSPLPPGADAIGWVKVAGAGDKAESAGDARLQGMWRVDALADAPSADESADWPTHNQLKLAINAKTPFDYASVANQKWDEWLTEHLPDYPCEAAEETGVAAVFPQPPGTELLDKSYAFDDPAFVVAWNYGGFVVGNEDTVAGTLGPIENGLLVETRTGREPGKPPVWITPPPGVTDVQILVGKQARAYRDDRGFFGSKDAKVGDPATVDLYGDVLAFSAFYLDGSGTRTALPDPIYTEVEAFNGMLVASHVELIPKVPATYVELSIVDYVPESGVPGAAIIHAFDSAEVEIPDSPIAVGAGAHVVNLAHDDISRLVIANASEAGYGTVLVEWIELRSPVFAETIHNSGSGTVVRKYPEMDGIIRVTEKDLEVINLDTVLGPRFTLLELSLPSRTDAAIRHILEALAQFKSSDPILEPETDYRMTIVTKRSSRYVNANATTAGIGATHNFSESVYFRTAAPPGIGVPSVPSVSGANTGAPTGFEDLSFYVKRTVPEVPAAAGGHQSPGRAFYRAYDVDVEFSEATVHVNTMYRLDRRSLSLRLFDAKGVALRDENGITQLSAGHWSQSNDPSISASAEKWTGAINAASCVSPKFDLSEVLGGEQVTDTPRERLLEPEQLYQARLVPMLLHEPFAACRAELTANGQGLQLDRWRAENASADVSNWAVRSEDVAVVGGTVKTWYATESSGTTSSLLYEGSLVRSSDTGSTDHPSHWSDVRASVQVRVPSGEAGLELRRASGTDLLRISLSRTSDSVVLLQMTVISGGSASARGQISQAIGKNDDVTLVVDCLGSEVTVYLQPIGASLGAPLLSINDAPATTGTVALLASGAGDVRFSEVQIHDLTPNPTTAYRFDFITSKYADFAHHLHSYDDQVFDLPAGFGITLAELSSQLGAAVTIPVAGSASTPLGEPTEAEWRAFDALEPKILGSSAARFAENLEVLRIGKDSLLFALMIRSPEPLHWERTTLSAEATLTNVSSDIPGEFKLIGASVAASLPKEESVTLLVRNDASLAGHRIEWRPISTTTTEPLWAVYYAFDGAETQLSGGTQVIVYSGLLEDAPMRQPGTTLRAVAGKAEDAVVRFGSPGIELRLVGPNGNVVHQRAFLTSESFAPLEMRALRNADGTALVLCLPSGATPPAGLSALRLNFALLRNAGTELPVWRRAGSEDAESASLVVPLVN